MGGMGIYRAGPEPREAEDPSRRRTARRIARIILSLLALTLLTSREPIAAAMTIFVALAVAWPGLQAVCHGVSLPRPIVLLSFAMPLIAFPLASLPVLGWLLRTDWLIGLHTHAIFAVVGVCAVRYRDERWLARTLIITSIVWLVPALAWLGITYHPDGLQPDHILEVPLPANFAGIPPLIVLATGIPHVPLFFWWFIRRTRREGLAAAEAPPADAPSTAAAPDVVRRVYSARVQRTAASVALLACAAAAIAHGWLLFADGAHPKDGLGAWVLIGPAVSLGVWLLACAWAGTRWPRIAAAGLLHAQRREYASVTWPLAASMLVLPSLACGLVSAMVSESAIGIQFGEFLHLSLLGFFPCHVLVVLIAVEFGWAIQTRPTDEIMRIARRRAANGWLAVLITTYLWSGTIGARDTDASFVVSTAIFFGTLLAVVPTLLLYARMLTHERRALEASRDRS